MDLDICLYRKATTHYRKTKQPDQFNNKYLKIRTSPALNINLLSLTFSRRKLSIDDGGESSLTKKKK